VDPQRVAEDPAVLHETGEHPQLDLPPVQAPALGHAVVGLELVMAGVDARGVMAQVPRELDRRRPTVARSQWSSTTRPSASPRLSSRRSPCSSVRGPATSNAAASAERVAHRGEHLDSHVLGDRLGERVPGRSKLLGQQVQTIALELGHAQRGHAEPVDQRGGAVGRLARERSVQSAATARIVPLSARESRRSSPRNVADRSRITTEQPSPSGCTDSMA
jgi:hypothetical protein